MLSPNPLRKLKNYAFAALFVAAAVILTLTLCGVLGRISLLIFFLAWVGAAAFGGLGPGILATALSLLSIRFLFDASLFLPTFSKPKGLVRLAVFVIAGVIVSIVSEIMRRNRMRISQLNQQMTKLTQLTDQASFLVLDEQMRILRWSEGCTNLYGFTAEQATGRYCHELFGTGYPQPLETILAQLSETGEWNGELIHYLSDGTALHVASSWVSRNDGGNRTILKLDSDITGRRQAEESLRRTRDTLQAVLDAAPAAIIVADAQGGFIHVSAAAEKILGSPVTGNVHEPVGGYELCRLDGTRIPRGELPLSRVLRDGRPSSSEKILVKRNDGAIRVIWTSSMPLRRPDGSIWGATAVFQDITELEHTENALRRSERKFRSLFENSPDAVFLTVPDGAILAANPAACRMFERSEQELCGLSRSHILADDPKLTAALQERKQTGRFRSLELTAIRKNGEECFPVEIESVLVPGEPARSFVVIRDITERKRMENELRRSRDELELRVQERTRELSQTLDKIREQSEQLRRMTAQLTLAEQRERKRLSRILHDGLQQILVGAKYQIGSAVHSRHPERALDDVAKLIDEAIQNSRTLSAELSPPILLQGDLVSALKWLANWMRDKHKLAVSVVVRENLAPLTQTALLVLFQAIRELLFNVVKHAGVRVVRIDIHQEEGRIQVTVEDEGVGFDPDRPGLREGVSGGIGLFGIKERLSCIDGSMEIDSAPGQGSRFKLIVPSLAVTDTMGQPSTQPPKLPAPVPRPRTGFDGNETVRIVLVDDHAVLRQGLARLLGSERDFEIVGEASNGEVAVDLVRGIVPDVVLMDISMPRMNGIQATRIIHKELPYVRIIGLSMFDEEQQQAEIRRAGAVGYVSKSGDAGDLINAIRAIIQTSGKSFPASGPA